MECQSARKMVKIFVARISLSSSGVITSSRFQETNANLSSMST